MYAIVLNTDMHANCILVENKINVFGASKYSYGILEVTGCNVSFAKAHLIASEKEKPDFSLDSFCVPKSYQIPLSAVLFIEEL